MSDPSLPSIHELNAADEDNFLAALSLLFEGRTPLGHGLFERRPFASYEALIEQASVVCGSLVVEELHQVIDAHPRIGAPRTALAALSYVEQGYAAPPDLAEARVMAELAKLNQSYERRFGFRFIVFVNRRSKAAILPELRARLSSTADRERRAALEAILAIARDRLARLL